MAGYSARGDGGMNGQQLKQAIEQATADVAEHGYEGADLRQVMLAGFGYVGDKIEQSNKGVIRVQLSGKKFFVFGLGAGGAVVGAVQALMRLI